MAKLKALDNPCNWQLAVIRMEGDVLDDDGKPVVEELELWMRDVVAVSEELLGRPTFNGGMVYDPVKEYADVAGKQRLYGEMWTGDLWNELQVRVCDVLTTLRP